MLLSLFVLLLELLPYHQPDLPRCEIVTGASTVKKPGVPCAKNDCVCAYLLYDHAIRCSTLPKRQYTGHFPFLDIFFIDSS